MTTTVIKRSIVIDGRKTSISLEDEFWFGLKSIALGRDMTYGDLMAEIAKDKRGNLSSAARVFVLRHFTGPLPGASA